MENPQVITNTGTVVICNNHVCRICRLPIIHMKEEYNLRVFKDFFCSCAGSMGFICEECIMGYIRMYPSTCRECQSPWRHLRIKTRRKTFQEFLTTLREREDLNELQKFTSMFVSLIVVLLCAMIFQYLTPAQMFAIFGPLVFVSFDGWHQGAPMLAPRILYLIYLVRFDNAADAVKYAQIEYWISSLCLLFANRLTLCL